MLAGLNISGFDIEPNALHNLEAPSFIVFSGSLKFCEVLLSSNIKKADVLKIIYILNNRILILKLD